MLISSYSYFHKLISPFSISHQINSWGSESATLPRHLEFWYQLYHCALYIAQCTLHPVHCTILTVYCTLHTAHCTLHTAHCTLYTAHYTLNCNDWPAVFSVIAVHCSRRLGINYRGFRGRRQLHTDHRPVEIHRVADQQALKICINLFSSV